MAELPRGVAAGAWPPPRVPPSWFSPLPLVPVSKCRDGGVPSIAAKGVTTTMQRNHLPKLSAATLAVMSVFSAPSFAADPIALAPVVVTATRQPTRANELISAVDTIGREEIEQAGQSTLLELLALQPGIQITHNGGPGKNSALLIRGTNGNHAVLLIDGVRIGSVTTGQAAIESIPLSQIERIEILRRPLRLPPAHRRCIRRRERLVLRPAGRPVPDGRRLGAQGALRRLSPRFPQLPRL